MEIGNKIQELRKQKNLSQEQLAEKLDVARQTISKWELGETSPDLTQAKKLSQIFNISLDELTDNTINNVLIEKVSNTEQLAGIIIKLLKVIGLMLMITIVFIVIVIISRKYFEVQPNNEVADSYGLYCDLKNEKVYYEVTTTRESPNTFELNEATKEIVSEMKIDINTYTKKDKLIKEIKKYIISKGGQCK